MKLIYEFLNENISTCGSENPEVYLMGFSAGAGVIATLTWEYPEVKKILLLEPALGVGEESAINGISNYKGELYVVVGGSNEAIGSVVGNKVIDNAVNSSHKEILVISNCDYQFKGEINGRIMSEAPFYAFCDNHKIMFPDPKGGIKLYD